MSRWSVALKRLRIALIVILVLFAMAIGWLSDRAHDLFHYLVLKCGLFRLEEWLKQRSLLFASPIFAILAYGAVRFKVYELMLMYNHHFIKAISLGFLFKATYAGIANYFLRIYSEKLLAIRWIRYLYDRYALIRDRFVGYIKATGAYRIAHEIRVRLAALLNRPSLWKEVKGRCKKAFE